MRGRRRRAAVVRCRGNLESCFTDENFKRLFASPLIAEHLAARLLARPGGCRPAAGAHGGVCGRRHRQSTAEHADLPHPGDAQRARRLPHSKNWRLRQPAARQSSFLPARGPGAVMEETVVSQEYLTSTFCPSDYNAGRPVTCCVCRLPLPLALKRIEFGRTCAAGARFSGCTIPMLHLRFRRCNHD